MHWNCKLFRALWDIVECNAQLHKNICLIDLVALHKLFLYNPQTYRLAAESLQLVQSPALSHEFTLLYSARLDFHFVTNCASCSARNCYVIKRDNAFILPINDFRNE